MGKVSDQQESINKTEKVKSKPEKLDVSIELEDLSLEIYTFMNKILELNYKTPFMNNADAGCVVCREAGGKVVGGLLFTHRRYNEKHFVHIDYLAVDYNFRNYGLADKMIEKCIGYALVAGIDLITVRTRLRNAAARRTLEKHGFKVNENYICKYDDGHVRLPFYWEFSDNKKYVRGKYKYRRLVKRVLKI